MRVPRLVLHTIKALPPPPRTTPPPAHRATTTRARPCPRWTRTDIAQVQPLLKRRPRALPRPSSRCWSSTRRMYVQVRTGTVRVPYAIIEHDDLLEPLNSLQNKQPIGWRDFGLLCSNIYITSKKIWCERNFSCIYQKPAKILPFPLFFKFRTTLWIYFIFARNFLSIRNNHTHTYYQRVTFERYLYILKYTSKTRSVVFWSSIQHERHRFDLLGGWPWGLWFWLGSEKNNRKPNWHDSDMLSTQLSCTSRVKCWLGLGWWTIAARLSGSTDKLCKILVACELGSQISVYASRLHQNCARQSKSLELLSVLILEFEIAFQFRIAFFENWCSKKMYRSWVVV